VIVVDTNVVAYLLLPGERSASAERLLGFDPEWCAPLLWRSELRSVLSGWLRRGLLDLATASAIAEEAERLLRGREFAVPAREVLRRVAASRCTAYDCEFAVLAAQLGVPLLTTDRQILAEFPGLAHTPEQHLAS